MGQISTVQATTWIVVILGVLCAASCKKATSTADVSGVTSDTSLSDSAGST